MKHLTKFDTLSDYNSAKSSLIKPNVSLIASNDSVIYEPKPKGYQLYDYLHADGTVDTIPSSDVVGICVIPTSHYGKARFMSIVDADSEAYWKATNMTTADLPVFNYIAQVSIGDWSVSGTNMNDTSIWSLCELSDNSNNSLINVPSTWDQTSKYLYDIGHGYQYLIPSPYMSDGSLNPDYGAEIDVGHGDTIRTLLSDVNGYSYTQILLNKSATDYPAANACYSFDPGFGAGSWYLPSAGEFGYVAARITNIQNKLSSITGSSNLSYEYWTSSICGPNYMGYFVPIACITAQGQLVPGSTSIPVTLSIRPFIQL